MAQYLAYKSLTRNPADFSLLPLHKDCVFCDGFFNSEECTLVLLSKELREKFQLIPKINSFGEVEVDRNKIRQDGTKGAEKVERIRIGTNYDYYLSSAKDIEWFADTHIYNADEFKEHVAQSFIKKAEKQLQPQEEQ